MTILHLPPSSSLLPRHPQTPPPHEDPSSVLMDHASGLTLGGGDGDRGGAGRDVGGGDGRGRDGDGDGDGGGGDGDGGLESAVLDEIDRAAFSFCPAHQAPIPMAQEQSVEWRLGADSAGVRSWMIEGESGQLERVGEGGNRKRGREDGEVIDGGQEDVSRGGKEDALAGEGDKAKGAIREAAIATEAIAGTAAVAAAGARDEHHKGENCNESFQALELEGGRGGGGKQEEPGRENCNEEQCSSPSKSCLKLPLDPPSNDFFLLAPALLVYKRRRWKTQRPLQQRNRIAAFPHPASIDSGASMCELPSPQDQCSFDSNREPLPLTGREDRLRDGIDDCSKGWNDRKDEELEKGIRPRIGKLPVDGWTSQGCLDKDENGTVEIIVTSNKYHESNQFDLRTSQSLINGKTFHGRSFFVDISSSALEAGTPGSWQACSHSEKRIAGGRESHLEVGNGYYNELDEDARDEEVGNNTEAELGIVALNERVKSHTEAQASPFGSCEKMGIKNLMETDVEPLKHYYCSRYRQRMAVSRRDSGGVNALPGTELENNNRRLDMITKLERKRLVQRQSTPQKAEILTNGIKMKKKYISQDRCPLDSPRVDSRIEYITRSSLLAAKESEYKEQKPALQGSAPLHAAESPVSIISRQRKGRFHREVIALKNLMEPNSTDSDVLTPNRLRSHGARNTCNNREESKGSYYPARKRRKMQKVNELGSPLAGGTVLAPESGVELLAKQEASERLSLSKALNGSNSNSLFEESLHRRWKDINFAAANPTSLVGCRCKVYWPMDEEWYTGMIHEYDPLSNKHHVVYDDGDMEELVLAEEWVKLHLSLEEVIALEFQSICLPEGRKKPDYQEMAALAAGLEDWHGGFVHGDLIWAKIKGHPMWPAFVMDEMHADACGLEVPAREGMIPIQFFGSYDYARLSSKQVVPFSYGLLCKFYSKCRRVAFERGLEEAERYLKVQKLPDSMAKLQDEVIDDVPQENDDKETETSEEDEDFMGDERIHKIKKSMESLFTCPIKLGALQVLSLGKIVKDSEHFHDEHHIWTEGYTAVRKFASIKDPAKLVDYRMEVLKNPSARSMPLFRVILEDAEQIEGPTPSACWRKIFQRLDRVKEKYGLDSCQEDKRRNHHKSGALMFGFSYRRISKLIQALPNARACLKYRGWLEPATEHSEEPLPATFRPVEVLWKHPDRCSVCYLDEEYVNNMFLQCDKCRMLVHMHCYGESEPQDGHLWLCKLCRPGAPKKMPPCCLCPVQGGAMKKTTDGRWAHLTCAMWIPETCLVDIKRMEPIDGLSSISKDRWKLTCSICKVQYGVCIQCSELSCCVAYHILCARSAGLFIEVQEDFHPTDRDVGEEHERPIRLLSYCRRHRQPEDMRDCEGPQKFGSQLVAHGCSKFSYPHNISGCARSEPYDSAARRGRQEPEVRLAASTKRLFVEKMSYLVSGCLRNKPKVDMLPAKRWQVSKPLIQSESRGLLSGENPSDHMALASGENTINIFSMSERYLQMRVTLRQRLTFGKSAIHGWGIFTKQSHLTGDMVIEYAGEVVRPSVADLRERCTYNLLVGAGTYMFRIDDERVVDATRAGSIAHLINHSCEPNCYSRVISVGGEEHIIIFAKRDIEQGEELSYDYRFTSKGEQLDCYCGSPRCRGTVNLDDDDEEPAKICVSRKEVTDWVLRTSL